MKKIFLNIGIISFVAWGAFSCTNLDEKLYSEIPAEIYPENEMQASLQLLPMYEATRNCVDQGGWWFCQELTSDEVVPPTRHLDWDDGGKWRALQLHTWDNNTEALKQMWPNFFNGVTACNKIADNFATADPENPVVIKTLAKMKIMRAFYYYWLIDNYGDVPYLTSFANAPQQPFKTKRATIFRNIVAQLEESVGYLDAGQGSKTAVNRGMAFSLLAKLYLNAGVYTGEGLTVVHLEKANAYCDSVIALGYSLESNVSAPFVTANENSTENIFTIGYDENLKKDFCLHMRTLHYNHDQKYRLTVSPWNGFAVIPTHYDSYDDNDLRKAAYFLAGPQTDAAGKPLIDGETNEVVDLTKNIPYLMMTPSNTASRQVVRCSGIRASKFEVKLGAGQDLSNDYPIFRLADILLMKAEILVRLGQSGDDYLNQVRTRAGLGGMSGATLDDILAERGRELFWEAHRRQDLIRYGKYKGVNANRWADYPNTVATANEEIFVIPKEQTDKNPNLLAAPID